MTPETSSTEPWKIILGELDEKMGVKIVEESVERVVATMPVEGNRQSFGLLHGGASLAFGEAIGSWAAVIHASTWEVPPSALTSPPRTTAPPGKGPGHHHGHPHPPGRHLPPPRGADHERGAASGCARCGSPTCCWTARRERRRSIPPRKSPKDADPP